MLPRKKLGMRDGSLPIFPTHRKSLQANVGHNEHIDLYDGTLSIRHFTRNTSGTLSGAYTMGGGKTQFTGMSGIRPSLKAGWYSFCPVFIISLGSPDSQMTSLLPFSTGNRFCRVRLGNAFTLQTSQLSIYPENTPSKIMKIIYPSSKKMYYAA